MQAILSSESRNERLQSYDWLTKQPIKNNLWTYGIIRKIATGQEDNYATDCLLDYVYFKK